jgi:hypothetical protein
MLDEPENKVTEKEMLVKYAVLIVSKDLRPNKNKCIIFKHLFLARPALIQLQQNRDKPTALHSTVAQKYYLDNYIISET